jgi:hypothetical protein
LLDFIGERLRRFLGCDFASFTSRQGRLCLVYHRKDLETPTLAFLPERQGFLNRFLFATETSALNDLLNESPLVGRQLDVHAFILAPQRAS